MIRLCFAVFFLLASVAGAQEYGVTHRIKLTVGGESRKGALFLPKGLKKGEVMEMLVCVPDTKGKAYLEIGQWQQQSFDKRFAVFSVDVKTSSRDGWSPRDKLVMARDTEALLDGLDKAIAIAAENGVTIDKSAMVITGHSGGAYLAAWIGVRRPDLFLGVCLRAPVFHKETVEFGKLDTVQPNHDQRIYIYRGELERFARVLEQTDLAVKTFKQAGYRNVSFKIVPKMTHESKFQVCLDWFYGVLRETKKGREDARKIAVDLVKVQEAITKKRAGAFGKLAKLAEREKKAGFPAGAVEALGKVLAEAKKEYRRAEDLEAVHDFAGAVVVLKAVEKKFNGLGIAKEARKFAAKIKKSDGFKAAEMLRKAKGLKAKGKDIKAAELLEKITKQYPETAAAEEAAHLLNS